MTWKTSLAIVATSLILAGTAAAQAPGAKSPGGPTIPGAPPGAGATLPGLPGSTTPGTPGAITPGLPGTTPGLPGSTTPGAPSINDPSTTNPTFPCPPGQARRPGSPACIPGPTTK
jgi:hypothetical protein